MWNVIDGRDALGDPRKKKRMLRRGETTIVRLRLESIRVFLCMDAEDVRDCVEESDMPQTWLQARQAS